MRPLAFACSLALFLACHKGSSDRPRDVRASARDGVVEISWSPAARAGSYRVQLADLDTGQAVSEAVEVRGTSAKLPGAFSQSLGAWVEAIPGGRAIGAVTAGPGGGTATQWQLFGPGDFRGGVLHANFPQLAAGDRLGVLLVNAGGPDQAQASVGISGVGPRAEPKPLPDSLLVSTFEPAAVLHAPEAALPAEVAAPEPQPIDARRSFCVVPGFDFSRHVRKPSTRVALTDHAAFYVDDQDLSHYEAPFFDDLGKTFEERVWPALAGAFGTPTDVDANGRVLVLFTHELGEHLDAGWLIGYFGNADLLRARDDSSECGGTGSNHGEIVFLNDVLNAAANGWSAKRMGSTVYPATLAHELQHLINLGHRCVEQKCGSPEETWINEGLSKLAEDLAGYGWNGSIGRSEGAAYLTLRGGAVRGYEGRSLTKWEGDPIGNYQGVHSFMRFFADRMGPEVASAVESGAGGREGIEDALGRPLARAMAEWATALLVSNEQGAEYSYSGPAWSPLHQRLRPLEVRAPGSASLRTDGIAAFVSGAARGGFAQVTVKSGEETPPHVVVVRLPGDSPTVTGGSTWP